MISQKLLNKLFINGNTVFLFVGMLIIIFKYGFIAMFEDDSNFTKYTLYIAIFNAILIVLYFVSAIAGKSFERKYAKENAGNEKVNRTILFYFFFTFFYVILKYKYLLSDEFLFFYVLSVLLYSTIDILATFLHRRHIIKK